jgi:hypothetical protein
MVEIGQGLERECWAVCFVFAFEALFQGSKPISEVKSRNEAIRDKLKGIHSNKTRGRRELSTSASFIADASTPFAKALFFAVRQNSEARVYASAASAYFWELSFAEAMAIASLALKRSCTWSCMTDVQLNDVMDRMEFNLFLATK